MDSTEPKMKTPAPTTVEPISGEYVRRVECTILLYPVEEIEKIETRCENECPCQNKPSYNEY